MILRSAALSTVVEDVVEDEICNECAEARGAAAGAGRMREGSDQAQPGRPLLAPQIFKNSEGAAALFGK